MVKQTYVPIWLVMKWQVPATNLVCYIITTTESTSLLIHPPSQLHKIVHLSLALQHLQLPLQVCVHPQWCKIAQALLASDSSVQNGTQFLVVFSCIQPHCEISSTCCCDSLTYLHIKAAWNSDRLACCNRAAWAGGMWSSIRVPCVNSWHLASFTLEHPRLSLYMITVQRSRRSMCKEPMVIYP